MDALKCPKCAAVYSKAEALRDGVRVVSGHQAANGPRGFPPSDVEILRPQSPVWNGDAESLALESRLRLFAIPSALLVALAFHSAPLGHFLQRTFLSMPVHELGHAAAAWLSGFVAIPVVWKTMMFSESRGFAAPLLVSGSLIWIIIRGARLRHPAEVGIGVSLLALQSICTLLLPLHSARALIVFAGDGGAMIFAVLLMSSFYARRDSQLVIGWLRWGYLVIGAATFVDIFSTWWAACTDPDAIPFGENEGVALSDPSQLSDLHGWSASTIVGRYLLLGSICLIVLGIIYVRGLLGKSRVGRYAESEDPGIDPSRRDHA